MELVVLDVNGTLFPLDPVARRLAAVGLHGHLDVWFARVLRDGFAAATAGTLAEFGDLAGHHLAILLEEHDMEATEDRTEHVLAGFLDTTAHPDVAPALQRLSEAGVTVVTMTNGTVDITRDFLAREGLDQFVDATHDVAMAGRWKPSAEAYEYVVAQHGASAGEAAMIAVHPWDLHGAAAVGMVTGWVDRTGTPYPAFFESPDVRGATMNAVVDGLLVR